LIFSFVIGAVALFALGATFVACFGRLYSPIILITHNGFQFLIIRCDEIAILSVLRLLQPRFVLTILGLFFVAHFARGSATAGRGTGEAGCIIFIVHSISVIIIVAVTAIPLLRFRFRLCDELHGGLGGWGARIVCVARMCLVDSMLRILQKVDKRKTDDRESGEELKSQPIFQLKVLDVTLR
jgi:hypothetical protein